MQPKPTRNCLPRGPSVWTPERIALLRKIYPTTTTDAVARELGVSTKAVNVRASSMGLTKHKAPPPSAARPPSLSPAQRPQHPMTAAERERHARERITYPPDQLPWKARAMFAPSTGLPDLSHRSSSHRAT